MDLVTTPQGLRPKPAPVKRLAQDYGFAPGQSLIGQFGTTTLRFSEGNTKSVREQDGPGPGAYHPSNSSCLNLKGCIPGFGSDARVHSIAGQQVTPGPGTYGVEMQPDGGFVRELRQRWAGEAGASAFGTNAGSVNTVGSGAYEEPGPGSYNIAESSYFSSKTSGARSPFAGEARARLGSKLKRISDHKQSAAFSDPHSGRKSVRRAQNIRGHALPNEGPGSPSPLPGPGAYNMSGAAPQIYPNPRH